ncbi:unnamed protein product [Cylicocyclus nassatus]|uniref:Uncharacterized protein n=1 Tax=Cylicocyclus nassatus TaxID=53992 RepID=A0AA36GIV7_CYLNA|nr:unnamed protein product [Cylicocyclus nassatus]
MLDAVPVAINAETQVDIATRCKELKFQLDSILDLITIEAHKLENQSTEGVKTKLGQMLLKANELLRECTGSCWFFRFMYIASANDAITDYRLNNFQGLPKRRDWRHPGRPRNTTK